MERNYIGFDCERGVMNRLHANSNYSVIAEDDISDTLRTVAFGRINLPQGTSRIEVYCFDIDAKPDETYNIEVSVHSDSEEQTVRELLERDLELNLSDKSEFMQGHHQRQKAFLTCCFGDVYSRLFR